VRFLQLSELGLIDNLQIYNFLLSGLLCLLRAPNKSAYSLCASGHRRVLEYSLSYSSNTRATK